LREFERPRPGAPTAAGLWTARVNRYYLVSLPAVVVAIFAGD
jgi:hypothetical protein